MWRSWFYSQYRRKCTFLYDVVPNNQRVEDDIIESTTVFLHPFGPFIPSIQGARGWYYSQYHKVRGPPFWYFPSHPVGERKILLIASRGEEDIIPNITGMYIPFWYCSLYPGMDKIILVAISQGFYTPTMLLFRTTWYDSQYHRRGTSSCDIVSYIQGERMILLPISQGLHTPPAILFLISRRGEHNITLNISAGVHLVCNIFHNIQDGRGW